MSSHSWKHFLFFYFAEGKDGPSLKLASPFQSLWHGTVHLPVSDTQYILITLTKKTFQAFISLLWCKAFRVFMNWHWRKVCRMSYLFIALLPLCWYVSKHKFPPFLWYVVASFFPIVILCRNVCQLLCFIRSVNDAPWFKFLLCQMWHFDIYATVTFFYSLVRLFLF